MITRNIDDFLAIAGSSAPDFGPACAKAAFLVAPDGFGLAEQSASDNRYMDMSLHTDAGRALAQHRTLHRELSGSLPTICFPGAADTPDAQFPNNVFATAPGRLILGHMRHEVRQREAQRADIRAFFGNVLDYREIDLRGQPGICELTGALIIDRARGLGFAGLSERCDAAGAAAMHDAFGLRATLMFDLADGEYHTNVVMSVLAGRALVICPQGIVDRNVVTALGSLYAPAVLTLSPAQKQAFAGNCLALTGDAVWMSAVAADALTDSQHEQLRQAGFAVRSLALDEIEKAGGSLRCCVAEIF